MQQRKAWCVRLAGIDLRRLVFLDETGAKTNMTRMYARAKKGLRAVDHAPHGHWNTTTLIAGITHASAIAPMLLDGPMDTDAFEAYLAQVLIPALPQKAIVIMDNLPSHKSPGVTRLLHGAGAELWYLPPYSPDYNPIEPMWSKVKSYLRSAKARSQDELYKAIAVALTRISPADSEGFFRHCVVGIIS